MYEQLAHNSLHFVCIFFPVLFLHFLECFSLHLWKAPWVTLQAIEACRKHSKGRDCSAQRGRLVSTTQRYDCWKQYDDLFMKLFTKHVVRSRNKKVCYMKSFSSMHASLIMQFSVTLLHILLLSVQYFP